MIRSRFASAAAVAAFLAVPAFAQMSGSTSSNTTASTTTPSASANGSISATAPVPVAPSSTSTTSSIPSSTSSSTTQYNANAQNPASKARQAAIDQGRTPLCSELDQPNAGKLASKTTGNAAANSASAVHMDCIPDGASTTSGVVAGNSTTAKKKKPTT